ncbi:hypothetical protein EVG20_g10099 [Dentipellis fragilis]|uniref:Uncharacterized protein n=1 Tax=Dentipellis fragilis TaxID=205917 RepID=A0A4Y9XWF9_9AGAM|nr:hypothetical protein EVG20_g10099 [Dentipellis fragilis]
MPRSPAPHIPDVSHECIDPERLYVYISDTIVAAGLRYLLAAKLLARNRVSAVNAVAFSGRDLRLLQRSGGLCESPPCRHDALVRMRALCSVRVAAMGVPYKDVNMQPLIWTPSFELIETQARFPTVFRFSLSPLTDARSRTISPMSAAEAPIPALSLVFHRQPHTRPRPSIALSVEDMHSGGILNIGAGMPCLCVETSTAIDTTDCRVRQ